MSLSINHLFKYAFFASVIFLFFSISVSAQARPSFNTDLQLGDSGSVVRDLQMFLNDNGFSVSETGIGSNGQESEYFGPKTLRAVKSFQSTYSQDVLVPVGLSTPTGYWGPSSRDKAKDLSKAGTVAGISTALVTNTIKVEYWKKVNGGDVSDLTSISKYPNNPDEVVFLNKLEIPSDQDNRYGTRITGYVIPKVTGNYTFYLSSDDEGELYLSSDDGEQNKKLIAKVPSYSRPGDWTKYTEQKSSVIALEAGEAYYIEVLHKQSSARDNLAVGWTTPTNSSIEVIADAYLSATNPTFESEPEPTPGPIPSAGPITNWCGGADVDRNGIVGTSDIDLIQKNWNKSNCSSGNDWCEGADIDRDGFVGIDDLSLYSAYYGDSCFGDSGPTSPSDPTPTPEPTESTGLTNSLKVEYWRGLSGTKVSNLTSSTKYPNSPSETGSISNFAIPSDQEDAYGTKVSGYVVPQVTGNYTFYIASDDQSELYLSTNTNQSNKKLIASVPSWSRWNEWTKYSEQKSSSISLEAGHAYYVEALHKEGYGGDRLAVAWTTPTNSSIEVIAGTYLSATNLTSSTNPAEVPPEETTPTIPDPVEIPEPTTVPTLTVSGLLNGQTVSGDIVVQAITDVNPSSVRFQIGNVYDWTENAYPYSIGGDLNGQPVPLDSTSISNGDYTLTVTATFADGQVVTKNVDFTISNTVIDPTPIPTPIPTPTPSPTPEPGEFQIGVNLWEINSWSPAWTFVDVMKSAKKSANRDPKRGPLTENDPKGIWEFSPGVEARADENGWPILGSGDSAVVIYGDGFNGHYPEGKQDNSNPYVLTYEGSGTIDVDWDAENIRRSSNRIEFDVDGDHSGGIRITVTGPSDPRSGGVKNIKIWMPGFENSGKTFHPEFLKSLQPFQVIRFMDWQRTNDADSVVEWNDRTSVNYASQAARDSGVSVEHMVQLVNELDADPWFNMPHKASDDYVRKFATYVRDNLESNRKVYVEWSNEVWNSQFGQYRWVADTAGVSDVGSGEKLVFFDVWATEATRDFKIWNEVFAQKGQQNRLIRVAAGQEDDPWKTENLIKRMNTNDYEAISSAAYFGGYTTLSDAKEILKEAQYTTSHNLETRKKNNRNTTANLAHDKGKLYLAYEAGPHIIGSNFNAIKGAQTIPEMYDLYARNIEIFRNAGSHNNGGDLYVGFNHIKKWDGNGFWGHKQYQDEVTSKTTTPKYQALLDSIK